MIITTRGNGIGGVLMNSATDTFPRYAWFRRRKARVIERREHGRFLILDHQDAYRVVSDQLLTFIPEKSIYR